MQPRNRNYWEAKLRVDQIVPSNLCISQKTHRPKVGQLLVGADVISAKVLTDCIDVSKATQQKLGDVLVDSGRVHHRDVRSALLAQSLISDGVLGESTAVKMLARAAESQSELVDVLTKHTLEQELDTDCDAAGLAEILIDSNYASVEVVEEAKKRCTVSGVFLGRALLLMNAIPANLLDSALLVMGIVRDGKLTRTDAIKVLKESRRSKIGVEEAIESLKLGPKRRQKSITLGKICVEARLIDEFECLAALEIALNEQSKLGDVLVQSGMMAEKPLRLALLLQGLAQLGVISLEKSAQALQIMQNDMNASFSRVAEDMNLFGAETSDENSLVFLLRTASVVSKEQIEQSTEKFATYKMCTTKALLASGALTLPIYKIAIDCVMAIKCKQYGLTDAVQIVQLCQNSGYEYAEAFEHMQNQKRQGQAAVAEKAPVVESVRNSFGQCVAEWMSVPEYRQLVISIPLLGLAAVAVELACPAALMFWGYWTVFVALAVVLFRAGRGRATREVKQEQEKSFRLSQAKLTKIRLAKRS